MRLRERLQKAEEQAAALPAPAEENPETTAFLQSLTDGELDAFCELARRAESGDTEEQARLAGAWRQGPETLRAYLAEKAAMFEAEERARQRALFAGSAPPAVPPREPPQD